jgi:hemerythrin-like metal-binding protein
MLAFLEEYVEVHFCEEEQYMKYYGYSDYALHMEEHENFVMELYFLKEESRNIRASGLKGSYELSVETEQVVVDWLHDHVMIYDKKLGNFLKKKSNMNHDAISSLCGGEEHIIMGIVTTCSIAIKYGGRKGLRKQKENYKEILQILFIPTASVLNVFIYIMPIFSRIRDSERLMGILLRNLTSF